MGPDGINSFGLFCDLAHIWKYGAILILLVIAHVIARWIGIRFKPKKNEKNH